jgi:hypothetical protein
MSYVLHTNVAQSGQMDATMRTGEALLHKAMYLSSGVEEDSSWGVQFDQPLMTLFKGDSFSGRDTVYDENVELPDFELSGDLEYVFEKVTGLPVAAGTVTFTNEYTGEVRSLTVNAKGQITIE